MSEGTAHNKLAGISTNVLGNIASAILLGMPVLFLRLLKTDIQIVWVIIILQGSVWLSLLYLCFKKKQKWVRRFGFVGVIIIPFSVLFSLLIIFWPSSKMIILVSDFSPNPDPYHVTETIIFQLRRATREYKDVEIKALNDFISEQEGSNVALAKGKKYKAKIVLWGWYGKTAEKVIVTVHFETSKNLSYVLPLEQNDRILKLASEELELFTIQEQLSSEMSYLTLLTIGLACLSKQDYDGALNLFTNTMYHQSPEGMIIPDVVYVLRAIVYANMGNLDRAMADCNRAIELSPQSPENYNIRGGFHRQNGAFDLALADLDKAIELDPHNPAHYNNRGLVYWDNGHPDAAIADYDKAIELDPDDLLAYVNRGGVYFKKDDLDAAITDCNKAIKGDPNFFPAYVNRGTAHHQKGDLDAAIADYSKAIELNPDDFAAYSDRGGIYLARGNLDAAIADCTKAIELNPDDFLVYINRGGIYFEKGDLDAVIADYSKAIELNPDDFLVYINRGTAYFVKFVETDSDNLVDFGNAIKDYIIATKLNPDALDFVINESIRELLKTTGAIEIIINAP